MYKKRLREVLSILAVTMCSNFVLADVLSFKLGMKCDLDKGVITFSPASLWQQNNGDLIEECVLKDGTIAKAKILEILHDEYNLQQDLRISLWVNRAKVLSQAYLWCQPDGDSNTCNLRFEIHKDGIRYCTKREEEGFHCLFVESGRLPSLRDYEEYPEVPKMSKFGKELAFYSADGEFCEGFISTGVFKLPDEAMFMEDAPDASFEKIHRVSRFRVDLDNDTEIENVYVIDLWGRGGNSEPHFVASDAQFELDLEELGKSITETATLLDEGKLGVYPDQWGPCYKAEDCPYYSRLHIHLPVPNPETLSFNNFNPSFLTSKLFRLEGVSYFYLRGKQSYNRNTSAIFRPNPDGTYKEMCLFSKGVENM